MKQLIMAIIAVSAMTFAACNGSNNKKGKDDMSAMNSDTTKAVAANDDKDVKEITPSFASVDGTVAGYIKNIVNHYLHIKNALANDNSNEAINGAKMLSQALAEVDKSFLSADQKKVYDENEKLLKAYAENIGKSSDIKTQREHFSMLSENVYNLVKAFGGGRTLYHDHCPMYNKKGAMWISEIAGIKNPYMGSEMPTCGSVEEKIK